MQKNLVIVESPAKAKTIQNYLGDDYKVMSSYGHIRDLKKKNFGIDLWILKSDNQDCEMFQTGQDLWKDWNPQIPDTASASLWQPLWKRSQQEFLPVESSYCESDIECD